MLQRGAQCHSDELWFLNWRASNRETVALQICMPLPLFIGLCHNGYNGLGSTFGGGSSCCVLRRGWEGAGNRGQATGETRGRRRGPSRSPGRGELVGLWLPEEEAVAEADELGVGGRVGVAVCGHARGIVVGVLVNAVASLFQTGIILAI